MSGVLTGASGMGGPPIIFYYLSGSDPAVLAAIALASLAA